MLIKLQNEDGENSSKIESQIPKPQCMHTKLNRGGDKYLVPTKKKIKGAKFRSTQEQNCKCKGKKKTRKRREAGPRGKVA